MLLNDQQRERYSSNAGEIGEQADAAGDWAEAIELAGRFVAQMVNNKIETEGGGTLEPPIHPLPRK